MGSPAGVGDADVRLDSSGGGFKLGDAPDRAYAFYASVIGDGQLGRVVAVVFELLATFNPDGNKIVACCRSDDATHSGLLPDTRFNPAGFPGAGKQPFDSRLGQTLSGQILPRITIWQRSGNWLCIVTSALRADQIL